MKKEKIKKTEHNTQSRLSNNKLRTTAFLIFTFSLLICMVFACASSGGGGARGLSVEEFPLIEADIAVFPQLGHSDSINSVTFSPDGKQIISASSDNIIKLWDVDTGREIRMFVGHNDDVFSVSFSPDGRHALSASLDNTLRLWDVETGREIRAFSEHSDGVTSVSFSPDGRQALSGSSDRTVKLWDIETGIEIRTFLGHSRSVSSVSFSPDGRQAISVSGSTVKLWDISTGNEVRTFSGHSESVASVSFSPDGRQLLAFLDAGPFSESILKLWDIETGNEVQTILHRRGLVNSVSFSPDGRYALSGSGSTIRLWDTLTGLEVRTFSGHLETIRSVSFSPDGRYALSGSNDKTVKLWAIETGLEVRTFSGYSESVVSVSFSPDGRRAISVSGNIVSGVIRENTIKLWDIEIGREIWTIHSSGVVSSLSFSPDGKQAISVSGSTIKLWDIETGREIRTFSGHTRNVSLVKFSPNGRYALSGSLDSTVKLWDIETGREVRTFLGHLGSVNSVSFSPDGKRAISVSGNGSLIRVEGIIKLWDIETGREIRTFHSSDAVDSVSFNPDGKQAISVGRTVKLWDIDTGREVRTFGYSGSAFSVSFSPDGRYALSCSNNVVRLWDIETGLEIRTFLGHFLGHSDWFYSVSISLSPGGKTIASGSADGTVHLWDTETGNEIAAFISFSGSDTQLAAASRGLTVETQEAAASNEGEWLFITPDGYYQASPRGDRFLNVRVGNTVSGIDSYRSIFYNPDVVQARLQGRPDPASKANVTIQQAANFMPPTVTIQSPANFATTNTASTNLSVNITDQNQPIQNIKVFVNGRPAGRNELSAVRGQGLQAERTSLTVTGNQRTVSFELPLALDPGNNRIEVVAFNGYSENRRHVDVTWNAPAGQRSALPNLWVLAVGVNNYDNAGTPRLYGHGNLNFAVADARALINSLKAQEGRRYTTVNTLLIGDGENILPTTENIRRNLAFLDQAGDRDVVLLFIAGHGITGQGGKFFFLPRDAVITENMGGIIVDESRAISGDEITAILEGQGNRLLFIDACNSGGVDNDRMIRSMMESNAFVFAASQGNELSYESERWGGGHGVFTYNILNALRGAPAALAEGNVSVRSMSGFVSLEVPRQTENRQNPKVHSLLFADFPMAVIGQ